ncbi:hypothetical protein J4E81_005085 [Alternaria sp. BMP 2799]|uniref:uncharacterized protein n=1 Tax=Alternaria metachromatica TaxID=283354 RepID=UPI0020C579B5|nr:uncharacterized protein J4E83_002764 [Alternaria metachromatica]KAI4631233.1 hypothetical protein J4E83_002764 [Alternaria metachromatica]KAI4699191.1 hypothetical protein J4E81_005085 [Alternaria sp. BMP 2799]
MKFQLATALLAGTAAAVPTWPQPHPHKTNWTAPAVPELDKRVVDPVSIAIIGGVVSGIVGVSGTAALNIAKDAIDWNAAREAFTKATVAEMIKRAGPGEAAVCYNKGYDVTKPNQMRELSSVRFKSGVLNTDYDCFLMSGPDNSFYSRGDGGYINLAIQSPSNCKFDSATSDLYCA